MKTLPEILLSMGNKLIQSFGDDAKWLGGEALEKAQGAIAKELMGCLPEKTVYPDFISEDLKKEVWKNFRVFDEYNWSNTGVAAAMLKDLVIDEVRARLTAFIGKEK